MPGPVPPSDQASSPTRGDLALLIGLRSNSIDSALATLTAAVLNCQAAITAIDARLTAAELEFEPGIFREILDAARTDEG